MKLSIAIIGAGLSGLTLAHKLQGKAETTIFEKSRGAGGRMSTRYTDDYQFDHGAQFFTARSKSFQQFLAPFRDSGIVQQWLPKVLTLGVGKKPYKRDWFEPHYVGAPKMNSLCNHLAKAHNVEFNVHVCEIKKQGSGWLLIDSDQNEYAPFDWVVSSVPAKQAAELFPVEFQEYSEINGVTMMGCYCLMLGFSELPKFNWDAAKVNHSSIGWLSVDSSKPGRDYGACVVVHSTNEWAEKHIDEDQEYVSKALMDELHKVAAIDATESQYQSLHRWRYANTFYNEDDDDNANMYLIDHNLNLAACGDWLIKGHVESAYLSAEALAKALG
ncbi:NAD(P)/FAD-dependent oxidoreductase [Paraglaciecola sp. 2405UD69-4]|uniref:NAD(P)/FAD-dependent oxidoreductase n=1 Tax=Paraglaciecola sp. 2405UD69-4 TaxID=3391836 RepID=UPI0039C8FE82